MPQARESSHGDKIVMAEKKGHFIPSRAAELEFSRALRKVGRASGHLVEAHVDGVKIHDPAGLEKALKNYSKLLEPWAKRQSAKMLAKVSKSNRSAYTKKSKEMGKLLKLHVAATEVGEAAEDLMKEQVALIQSIPIRAGERAQKLSIEAVYNGTRSDEIAAELMRSSKVSESQARLIARTEVARANASITQARAQFVGAKAYIWRTVMDGAERHSHAQMNGEYVLYSQEPVLEDGTKGHAGTFPNCRCYQDVQFDDA